MSKPIWSVFCAGALLSGAAAEVELVARGGETEWAYEDSGKTPADGWRTGGFDDSGWARGFAPLGYGDSGLGTTVSFGGNPERKHRRTFFRTGFEVTEAQLKEIVALGVELIRDDGAVVYLNGTEVARSNVPISVAIGGSDEGVVQRFSVDGDALPLKAGANVVAVELHQAGPTSSDLFLDLGLVGYAEGEAPKRDYYGEGMRAVSRRDYAGAAELLKRVPEDHDSYAQAMTFLGYQLYGQALGRAEEGLEYVEKGYLAAPEERNILRAYLKAHIDAGVLFDDAALQRERPKTVAPEHQFLVSYPGTGDDSEKLSRADLEEDLDYLEHVLVHCFAYLELRDVDYKGALDAVRGAVVKGDGMREKSFTIALSKLISLFCDGHAAVGGHESQYLPRGFTPYAAGSYKGRTYLYDDGGLLDEKHPYVRSIDGKGIDAWLKVAGYVVPKESPQWYRRGALGNLRYVSYLRSELGLEDGGKITLELESEDGADVIEKVVERSRSRIVRRAEFPRAATGRMGDVGYLRVPQMTRDPGFLRELESWMEKFRDTKGLIIDLRGNTGGTKNILFTLFPYFVAPDAPLQLVEFSTYRLPMEVPRPAPQGFMMSDMSAQPVTSKRWTSDAERAQVRSFIDGMKPSWEIPMDKFSAWHVLALDASINPDAYHYDKPLVILQDSATFSAGDIFLGAFEDRDDVTLMGEASGGGNGWMERYRLPNSGLTVVLCQSAKFRPSGAAYDGEGIAPDVAMEATPEDVLGDTDSVLEAALERLRK